MFERDNRPSWQEFEDEKERRFRKEIEDDDRYENEDLLEETEKEAQNG